MKAALASITAVAALAVPATAAHAATTGTGGVSPTTSAAGSIGGTPYAPPATAPLDDGSGVAQLVAGKAYAPAGAPLAVRRASRFGNKIQRKPYVYGGGHASFTSAGYDCSGAVSFALHGARLLTSPLDSTSFMSWGAAGPGAWITVYANPGHAYAVIAGLRLDTSGTGGRGPRWLTAPRRADGFTARHPAGL